MKFAITGAKGLVGGEISRHLRERGHQVTPVTRSYSGLAHGQRAVIWHPDRGDIEADALEGHDVVIHLAGESLAGVWTPGRKRRILASRVQGTTLIARTIAALRQKPRALFSASAVGIYGDRPPDQEIDETAAPGEGFLADVVKAWEASTQPAEDAGVRVVHMRFGNVISPHGGLLAPLLPLFRLGLGATIGSGRQVWPWIAGAEIPAALLHVLQQEDVKGPVNFVAPEAPTNAEFTEALAHAVHRPTFISVPKFAMRLAPGGMADDLLLSGARAVPRKLLDSGYVFLHPRLAGALKLAVE